MKDKTILITGSSSGIGFATAMALAAEGAKVILAARNEHKLKEAAGKIEAATGNKKLKYYVADFSSQKSVRALAENVKRDYDKLDVLINNAGAVFPDFALSEDGLEMTIATNHFAYFLLTNLLLDLVKKSHYARIINVSSNSHYRGKIDIKSFTKNKGYFITKAYAQSKLANLLFTFELAERLKNTHVTVNALHPGFVKTEIGNKGTQWYAGLFWTLSTRLKGMSVDDGAKTSVYLALSKEVKGVSGRYFVKCAEKKPLEISRDKHLQHTLWKASEKLCPLT